MAQKIRIKRRQANGGAGAPTTLASAELAFNEASQILYYGLGDTGTGEANSVIAIGGQGAFIPSSGGTGYVKSIAVTDGTGLSKSEDNGNVTLAGIDATTTVKGVVRLATQEEINNGTPGVVPDASLFLSNKYSLPIASADILGGFKVGSGLSIDGNGKLDVTLEQGTVYKGEADFTDASAEPEDADNGWIYSNKTEGTAAWTGIDGEPVTKGVQAIWSEEDNKWSLIASAGGVTAVTGIDPIEVDISTNGADEPIVKIKDSSESQKGAVQLATDTQITNGTAGVAVQASQLKNAIDNIDALPSGSATGELLQWNNDTGEWKISAELDGGSF